MNIAEADILLYLKSNGYSTQKSISEKTGYSVGKVNSALNWLLENGYLEADYGLTEKSYTELSNNKPGNAIILAAGYGLRMIPINREVPKALLEVKGEVLIERTIRQLKEAGIDDISIVVGFKKESFDYLIDEYGVKLVVNRDYSDKNNLHSLNLCNASLGNTYVIPSDIWCEENPFSCNELYSWYMVTDALSDESFVRINRKQELVAIEAEEQGNQMIGISYINDEDAMWLRYKLDFWDQDRNHDRDFWEFALFEKNRMQVASRVRPFGLFQEINTYEQLREFDDSSRNLRSDTLDIISNVFNTETSNITDIKLLKKGMTNRSFFFSVAGRKYIMRIPGEGTDLLINRRQEYEVYKAIASLNLSDKLLYFNPDNGYKITEFIEGSHCCALDDWDEIADCLAVLKDFHSRKLKVDHYFDIFGKMEFYESLWNGAPSCFRDYESVKANVLSLKSVIEASDRDYCLCHIDSVPDNFLINDEGIRLIDWEYAAMQDPDVDIAMFGIYACYDKPEIDRLIDIYHGVDCSVERRRKIYCYVAACGLLWSNWCEFKRLQGVEFGEYAMKQYRYAKDFYRYACELEGDVKWKRQRKEKSIG